MTAAQGANPVLAQSGLPYDLPDFASISDDDFLPAFTEAMASHVAEVQAIVAASRMVDAVPEFAAALSDAGLGDVQHVIYDDEDHSSVVPAAMMRGLRFAVPE